MVSPVPRITLPERVAIVVSGHLPAGLMANTVAVIGIGIGARCKDLGGTLLTDAQGRRTFNSASLPVPVLQASEDQLRALLLKATAEAASQNSVVVAFPQFARTVHSSDEYWKIFPSRDLAVEPVEGVGIAGGDKWVRSLTGNLKLR